MVGYDLIEFIPYSRQALVTTIWLAVEDSPFSIPKNDVKPEIRQSLLQEQGHFDASIDFIPYRGDFARGIFATEVVKTDAAIDDVVEAYKTYYAEAPFTHYVDKPIDLKQVVNTNKALVHCEKYGDKLLITSCIDNLLKGAVGQAVQNMNIMRGIDETAGLRLKPSAF